MSELIVRTNVLKFLLILLFIFIIVTSIAILFYLKTRYINDQDLGIVDSNLKDSGINIIGSNDNKNNKEIKNSIFIFRRDFRYQDNIGLINCLKDSKKVYPIFIFTPEQIKNNSFKSNNAIQFMIESLKELNKSIKNKLQYFYGKPDDILQKLIKKNKIDAVYVNEDYTPYSIKRDKKLSNICKRNNCLFKSFRDIMLFPVGHIKTTQGKPYTKFTHFKNAISKMKLKPDKPSITQSKLLNKLSKISGTSRGNSNLGEKSIEQIIKLIGLKYNKNLAVKPGRSEALKILRSVKKFKKYNNLRNDLTYSTTNLSAYLKFGCISIRETYDHFLRNLGKSNQLITQLYWREFYYNIMMIFGYGLQKPIYSKIKWKNNPSLFKKWCEGKTGFPVIDAGMRQLNETGYMHNRARLLTSNFLCKVLLIDWRKGEKYYATQLVDYDPAMNLGNWQWSSSAGISSQDYFMSFNPWNQQKDYDPDCEYIKTWVPELSNVDPKVIHKWYNYSFDDEIPVGYSLINRKSIKYPDPVVDYSEQKEKQKKMYGKIYKK